MSSMTGWTKAAPEGRSYLYYFTSGKHALSNVEKRQVKISRFDKCNDIFELASFSMESREVRTRHEAWLEKANNSFGLICLSRRWRKALMWAHYGDTGRGACLVFSIPKAHFTHVEYIPKRLPSKDDFQFPEPRMDFEFFKFSSKKFSAWRYESEARHFCNLNDNQNIIDDGELKFLKFSHDFELVGIINGPKPSISQVEFLDAFKKPLEFFQCRAAFTGFHLTSQRQKELWK